MASITIYFESLRGEEQQRIREQVRQDLKEENKEEPTEQDIVDFINNNNVGQTFVVGGE